MAHEIKTTKQSVSVEVDVPEGWEVDPGTPVEILCQSNPSTQDLLAYNHVAATVKLRKKPREPKVGEVWALNGTVYVIGGGTYYPKTWVFVADSLESYFAAKAQAKP